MTNEQEPNPAPTKTPWTPLWQVESAPVTRYESTLRAELAAQGVAGQNFGRPLPPPLTSSLDGPEADVVRDIATDVLKQGISGLLPGISFDQSHIVGGWYATGTDTYETNGNAGVSTHDGAHSTTILATGDTLMVVYSAVALLSLTNANATSLSTPHYATVLPTLSVDGKTVHVGVEFHTAYYGTTQNWQIPLSGVVVITNAAVPGSDIVTATAGLSLIKAGAHAFKVSYGTVTTGADAASINFSVRNEAVIVWKVPGIDGDATMPVVIY